MKRIHILVVLGMLSMLSLCSCVSLQQAEKSVTIDAKTVKKWSAPYRNWHYQPGYVIPPAPNIKGYEAAIKTDIGTIFQLPGDDKWYMSFVTYDGLGYQSFITESEDLLNWKNYRFAMGYGPKGTFYHGGIVLGGFLYENYDIKAPRILKKRDGKYWSLFLSFEKQGGYELKPGYGGVATSKNGFDWILEKPTPILSVHDSGRGEWEKHDIYMSFLVEHGGKYWNFYNASQDGYESMGIAFSDDLVNWKRHDKNPILAPSRKAGDYHEQFIADGKVFKDGDHWIQFLFGVGKGSDSEASIFAAYSRDLLNWTLDEEPLYKAGGNPSGIDSKYAHKISLVWNPANETYYMFYNAVGNKGRGIGLITSKPLDNQ